MLETSPRSRRRLALEILFIIILCSTLAFLSIKLEIFKRPVTDHTITYRVTSSGGFANITYTNRSQKNTDPNQITTPWELSFPVKTGMEVYLTAANTTESGEIECIILLDRKSWKKQTAKAPDTNVACGGIIP